MPASKRALFQKVYESTCKNKSFKFEHGLQCPLLAKILKQYIVQVMTETFKTKNK